MKKIIHKLTKNRLVSKIAALLTICMILVSSFTVSSFAADEEEATNSITDVWTGVTDSIMSLIGTAQGVFYNERIESFEFSAYGDPINAIGGQVLYCVEGIPVLTSPNSFEGTTDFGGFSLPSIFGFEYYEDFLLGFIYLSNTDACVAAFYPEDSFIPGLAEGWYMTEGNAKINNQFVTYTFTPSVSGGTGLTFLGTLAVVGVAIALIMLLVYVISRFLRLRG